MKQGIWVKRAILTAFLGILLFNVQAIAQVSVTERWRVNLQEPATALTIISDVSDDGIPDVIAGTDGGLVLCVESVTGEEWWSYHTLHSVWSLCGIGDVDGKNQEDVIAGTSGNDVFCFSGENDGFGGGVVIWQKKLTADIWTLCSIGDIPKSGDGLREAVIGDGNGLVTCLSGKDGATLWSTDAGMVVWSVARCPSVNGDATDEVIVGTGGNMVLLLDGATGVKLWEYLTIGDVWTVSFLEDIDGDDAVEVLAGTSGGQALCLSGNATGTPTLLWSFSAGADVRAISTLPNVRKSSTDEVVVGSAMAGRNLYLLDGATGLRLWWKDLGGEVLSIVPIQDSTQDGGAEIVCGTRASKVDAVRGYFGNPFWSYLSAPVGEIKAVAALTDLNGDGVEEIVSISTNGIVNCLDSAIGPPIAPQTNIIHWILY